MLELRPKGWFSWDFHVLDHGQEIAYLSRRLVREKVTFEHDGAVYTVRRASFLRSTFVLERDGQPIAEARKPSAFRRRFEIHAGPERWTLEATAVLRRGFRLHRGGLELGVVRPVAMFRRDAVVDLVDAVPLPLQIFVATLVLVLWKRAADAAAAGG